MNGVTPPRMLLTTILFLGISFASDTPGPGDRAEQKFNYIQQNGQREKPDPRPTEFSESEINAYLNSGKLRLPDGVESLRVEGLPGVTTAHCRVDFDRVRAGRTNSNPMLRLFSGIHDVEVEAHASGVRRTGHVHVDSVVIDGIEVPQFLLQIFVEKYITSRYPGIGIDSTFPLPDKIDTATVGRHQLTVVQR